MYVRTYNKMEFTMFDANNNEFNVMKERVWWNLTEWWNLVEFDRMVESGRIRTNCGYYTQ